MHEFIIEKDENLNTSSKGVISHAVRAIVRKNEKYLMVYSLEKTAITSSPAEEWKKAKL